MRRTLLFSALLGSMALPVQQATARSSALPLPSMGGVVSLEQTQQNTVRGTVSDGSGPLLGVTVNVVGEDRSTSTDSEGRFTIQAPIGSQLRFTFLGYDSRQIEVAGATMNVQLQQQDQTLDEVVVVGYGSQKRSNITGSVSTVDTEKTFETRPITDVGRALQGAVSGLSVSTPSGDLGGDPTIRLRGVSGSLQTDGVPHR